MHEDRNKRFARTVLPHLDAVYRAAVALSGRGPQAEDLAQTTMMKALATLDSFAEGTNCRAWLLRILRNTWIDTLRRGRLSGAPLPLEEATAAAPEEPESTAWTNAQDLLDNFSDEEVIAALGELPDDQRLTLYLSDVERMDQRDIAEILDVQIGTIKSRTSRARAVLKKRLYERAKELGFTGRMRRDSCEQ